MSLFILAVGVCRQLALFPENIQSMQGKITYSTIMIKMFFKTRITTPK